MAASFASGDGEERLRNATKNLFLGDSFYLAAPQDLVSNRCHMPI
jgi:hypothetical protein